MTMKIRVVIQMVSVLACAGAMKIFYSMASVNDLRWILSPTTSLVQAITGRQFKFESYTGYVSEDRTFVIAASCAGVNFLITSFLLLSLSKILRAKGNESKWTYFPVAALIAYLSTIAANSIRITTSLWQQRTNAGSAWFTRDEVHRLDGIVIYFGVLLLLYFTSEAIRAKAVGSSLKLSSSLLLPLIVYYAATLGIPIITGAYAQFDEFREHALFVFFVPLVLISMSWTIYYLLQKAIVIFNSWNSDPDLI
jgi:exosortase K